MHSKDEALCINMLEAVNKILEITRGLSAKEEFVKEYIRFDMANNQE